MNKVLLARKLSVNGVNSMAQGLSVDDTMTDDLYFKGWVPWTERIIPLDAVLKALHEIIIFMEG